VEFLWWSTGIFPDCQAERLGGDIMLLSTLDKNHLSNTISELLIG
jgi:hypothetical protein